VALGSLKEVQRFLRSAERLDFVGDACLVENDLRIQQIGIAVVDDQHFLEFHHAPPPNRLECRRLSPASRKHPCGQLWAL
jgi:hypothetical protein